MNSLVVAALVFAFTFGGALAGLWLHARLPDHHLGGDSRDVVKLVMGLIATVAALVLGLLISTAHRSYEAQGAEVQQIGVHLFQLDRALEQFGPEAKDARAMLYRLVRTEVERASAPGGIQAAIDSPLEAQKAAAALFDRISTLSPKDGLAAIHTKQRAAAAYEPRPHAASPERAGAKLDLPGRSWSCSCSG